MYKKTLIGLLLCCILTGCSGRWGDGTSRIPQGNSGDATQSDKVKERVVGSIEGEITLPELPALDEKGKPLPNQKIRIDGVDAELPVGSKGKFILSASGRSSLDSFTAMSSTWKLNSAPVQLFVFGGIMVAVGGVLMFFGMWRLGLAAIIGGVSLIACGIMINQYPWVVLIVVGIGLIAAVYYVYMEIRKKSLLGESQDVNFVLEELTNVLSDMPEDLLEQYVKQPLREHDQSGLIRQITKTARLKR
jgi:hypothetical protein